MKSKKDGITLIALVVTIIILLLLAAVSINALLGKNGIIEMAKDASRESAEKSEKEKENMEKLEEEMNNLLKDKIVLDHIEVTYLGPTVITNDTSHTISNSDIKVMAYYTDHSMQEKNNFTISKTSFTILDNGEQTITVTYEEEGISVTADFTIIVAFEEIKLDHITVSYSGPQTITNTTSNTISNSDITVIAYYTDNSHQEKNNFTISKTSFSAIDNGIQTITVTYQEGDISKSASFTVTVAKQEYLLKDGNFTSLLTPTGFLWWDDARSGTYGTNKEGNAFHFWYDNTSPYGAGVIWRAASNVDFAPYKKLYIKYRAYGSSQYVGNGAQSIRVLDNWTIIETWYNTNNLSRYDTGVQTISHDISSWSGKKTFEMYLYGCGGAYHNYLYDIWLE